MYQRMRPALAITVLVLLAVPVFAAAPAHLGAAYIAITALATLRWLVLTGLVVYACFRPSLTNWIFISMLLGAEIGHDFPAFGVSLRLLAQIFLRLIKVIIAPLLFSTLVSGIAGHADLKKVGRMGVKALVFFEIVTTLALFIGLAAINLSQAGVGAQIPANTAETVKIESLTPSETVLHVFPENIAKSVAENQILQVVIFSLLFGVALALVKEEKRRPMLAFTESLAEVMFKFTNIVMWFAPLGILGAIAATVGSTGVGILGNLARLLLTLYGALAVFLLTVLLPVALLAKVPIARFIRAVAEPATIAFSTASSEAALPSAMERWKNSACPARSWLSSCRPATAST